MTAVQWGSGQLRGWQIRRTDGAGRERSARTALLRAIDLGQLDDVNAEAEWWWRDFGGRPLVHVLGEALLARALAARAQAAGFRLSWLDVLAEVEERVQPGASAAILAAPPPEDPAAPHRPLPARWPGEPQPGGPCASDLQQLPDGRVVARFRWPWGEFLAYASRPDLANVPAEVPAWRALREWPAVPADLAPRLEDDRPEPRARCLRHVALGVLMASGPIGYWNPCACPRMAAALYPTERERTLGFGVARAPFEAGPEDVTRPADPGAVNPARAAELASKLAPPAPCAHPRQRIRYVCAIAACGCGSDPPSHHPHGTSAEVRCEDCGVDVWREADAVRETAPPPVGQVLQELADIAGPSGLRALARAFPTPEEKDALGALARPFIGKRVARAPDGHGWKPCAICGQDFDGGDRYQAGDTRGVRAHADCVQSCVNGIDPREAA